MWLAVAVALLCVAGLVGWRWWLSHLRWREEVAQKDGKAAVDGLKRLEERLSRLELERLGRR